MPLQDSEHYLTKKRHFAKMLTIFGRKPVLEALQDKQLPVYKLHLSESNKPAKILDDMNAIAAQRGVSVAYHDKQALSRVSKNAKQDQGVALDIQCQGFMEVDDFLGLQLANYDLIALDGVTNPQNVGMIIRSVCASPAAGLLIPEKGCAKLDALVIKASAGTLFKARLIRCKNVSEALNRFALDGSNVYGLEANAQETLAGFSGAQKNVFVLGNESEGLSHSVSKACTHKLSIPMCHGVESLNVAVTASLIAFRRVFNK